MTQGDAAISTEAENACCQIYTETNEFYWNRLKGPKDVGFQILYGPPHFRAPVLFLGYQPGRGCKKPQEEREYGSEHRYPKVCEYATECWPLATTLRKIVGKEKRRSCVGLNAIFVRANNIAEYHSTFKDARIREEIRSFCAERVAKIIEVVCPKKIVVIGLLTLNLFPQRGPLTWSDLKRNTRGENGVRVLTKVGHIAGHNTIAVMHLTGAHISTHDRQVINAHLISFILP